MTKSNPEERKNDIANMSFDGSDTNTPDQPTGERKRRKLSPSKSELQEQLSTLQRQQEIRTKLTPEQVGLISSGLLLVVEGLTHWPFTKVEPELKKGFDTAGADCLAAYLPENVDKWVPLIQLGTMAALVTADVLEKRKRMMAEQPKVQPSNVQQ